MTKMEFWQLMDVFRKDSNGDNEIFLQSAQEYLSSCNIEDVCYFGGYLGAYMEAVNECVWVDMACKVINGYVSDDTGLYFALWLISQGEEVLVKSLIDPDSLAEVPNIPFGNAEFEMLMSITYELIGEEMVIDKVSSFQRECLEIITPDIHYKNNDKYGNYEYFEEAMEDIPNVLPRLIERAASENFDWKNLYEF